MARTPKQKTIHDINRIDEARLALCHARDLLAEAGAKNAADYVRRAIKSAEGARRHADAVRGRAARGI